MKAKNQPIGTCPCPHRSCERQADIFRFAARTDDPTRSRFAGKVYAQCAEHGRFGVDGAEAMQEYILNNKDTVIWKPGEAKPAAPPVAAKPEPAKPQSTARQAPASQPAAPPHVAETKPERKSRDVWDL